MQVIATGIFNVESLSNSGGLFQTLGLDDGYNAYLSLDHSLLMQLVLVVHGVML